MSFLGRRVTKSASSPNCASDTATLASPPAKLTSRVRAWVSRRWSGGARRSMISPNVTMRVMVCSSGRVPSFIFGGEFNRIDAGSVRFVEHHKVVLQGHLAVQAVAAGEDETAPRGALAQATADLSVDFFRSPERQDPCDVDIAAKDQVVPVPFFHST